MLRTTLALLVLSLPVVLSLPAVAAPTPPAPPEVRLAQAPPAPPAPPGLPDRPGRGKRLAPEERARLKEEVQRKIQTYVTVELSSALGLDDKKALKLSDAVKAQMKRKDDARLAVKGEMEKLQKLVDAGADDGQLKAELKAVTDAAKRLDDMGAFLDDAGKFLTVKEQARLVIVFPGVRREIGRMLKDAMRERRGARGGFGGKDKDDDDDDDDGP